MSKGPDNEYPNGFTAVPNPIYDAALKHLKGAKLSVYLCIFRKTIGWNKKGDKDKIPLGQIAERVPITRRAIIPALQSLIKDKWVFCNHGETDTSLPNFERTNTYQINRNHPKIKAMIESYGGSEKIALLGKNCTTPQNGGIPESIEGGSEKIALPDKKGVVKKLHYGSEEIAPSKETIQKKISKEIISLGNDPVLDNREDVDKPVKTINDDIKIIQGKILDKYRNQITAEPPYSSCRALIESVDGDAGRILNAIDRMPIVLKNSKNICGLIAKYAQNTEWGTNSGGNGKPKAESVESRLAKLEESRFWKCETIPWNDPGWQAFYIRDLDTIDQEIGRLRSELIIKSKRDEQKILTEWEQLKDMSVEILGDKNSAKCRYELWKVFWADGFDAAIGLVKELDGEFDTWWDAIKSQRLKGVDVDSTRSRRRG